MALSRPRPPTDLAPPQRPAAVQLRARRSNRLIVLGVLCACLGALIMAWVWTGTQESQTVVVMAAHVARGEQVEAADLTTTTLGRADGVAVVSADQASALVGQYALVDLPAGSLPGPDAVGVLVVPAGHAQLGLRLAAGRLPSQPLPPVTRVWLIAVPGAMDANTGPGAQYEAVVASAPLVTTDGNGWLVDVQVEESVAGQLAALAAVDRIAMVRRGDA